MKTKTTVATLIFACLMVYANTSMAQRLVPVTSLEDWGYEGTWQFSGNSATTTVNQPETYNHIGKNYEGSIGIQATINISSIQGNAGCHIGKSPGYTGTDNLRANILFGYYNLTRADGFGPIWCYLVRADDTADLETYMDGFFGDWQYMPGQDVTVSLSRVDNEVWYYVEGYGTRKFEPPFTMEGTNNHNWFGAQVGEKEGDAITVTIKDVYIIYP